MSRDQPEEELTVSLLSQLSAVPGTVRYNRDWARYILARWTARGDDDRLTFRLRNVPRVTMRASMRPTLNEIFIHHVYDVPGVDFAACRHVFDLGANMGVFAIYLATRAPLAKIHCFEPASSNFPLLEQNLRTNSLRALGYRLAVSTRCGARQLHLAGREPGEYKLKDAAGESETVDCVDLARVFDLTGAACCDFLKMDIEGEELPILRETPLAVLQRVRAMAIEWHHRADPLNEVRKRLASAGFETLVRRFGQEVILQARQRSEVGG
jgi:FkbM family methyltransferase